MKGSRKPTAFIDLDGPILDVRNRHYHVYLAGIRVLGGSALSLDEFWCAKRQKITDAQILQRSKVLKSEKKYEALKIANIESRSNLGFDLLQPGVEMALTRIAERYILVLVTLRQSRSELMWQLKSLGLIEQFSTILSSPAKNNSGWKTKCDLVTTAGIRFDEKSFFAGDTETDILAGKALKIQTVAVVNGIREHQYLQTLSPDWIVPNLSHLFHTPLLK